MPVPTASTPADDEGVDADYLLVKQAAPGGEVCVFDLSLARRARRLRRRSTSPTTRTTTRTCSGSPVSAGEIGLSNGDSELAYQVTPAPAPSRATSRVSSATPRATDGDTGSTTRGSTLADPALAIDPLICGGFWGGGACDPGDPIEVSAGGPPGDDPAILALFPNNKPSRDPAIVTTTVP